ncbi:MAG: T9SS type A sorting domain-containing protein [Bacteroidota bacterium]
MKFSTTFVLGAVLCMSFWFTPTAFGASFYSINNDNFDTTITQILIDHGSEINMQGVKKFKNFLNQRMAIGPEGPCDFPRPIPTQWPRGDYGFVWDNNPNAFFMELGTYDLFSAESNVRRTLDTQAILGFDVQYKVYTFAHLCPSGRSYLNIIIVDKDFFVVGPTTPSWMIRDGGNPSAGNSRKRLSVSPNPVQDILQLEFELPHSQEVHFRISDLNGRQVLPLQYEGKLHKGVYRRDLDMSHLPSGIYLCQIWFDAEQRQQKIVKTQ